MVRTMEETEKTAIQPYQVPTGKGEINPSKGRTPALARTRDVHIDVMKGVGMLLVLVFHMQSIPYLGYSIIGYSAMFIMPMFFFVSGYLFPFSSDAKLGFGRYALKKVLTLWVPYTIFFAVYLLWTETVYAYATGTPLFAFDFNWVQLLRAYLLAGMDLYNLAVVPFPLWFLHALFFTSLVFYFVAKIKFKSLIAVIAVLLALASLPLQTALQDSPILFLRLFPLALFYMLCGLLFRQFISVPTSSGAKRTFAKNVPVGGFVSMVCILLGLYCLRLGGGEMWSIASYWHIPGALVAILGCYLFCQCTDNRILQFVGRYSLLYLALHPMVVKLPFINDLPLWFEQQGFDGVIVYTGYFIISFLLITVLVGVTALLQTAFRRLTRRKKVEEATSF